MNLTMLLKVQMTSHSNNSTSSNNTMKMLYLNNIGFNEDSYTVKVRVLRLWKRKDLKNPAETFTIEMVLMDEEGTKMLATVWKKFLVKYEKQLKESHCFYFTNPQLAQIRTKYKHFSIDNMLSFNLDTHIKKCDDFKGSLYGFNFSSFTSLGDGSTSTDLSIDIIGYVESWFTPETTVTRFGKTSKKMALKLQDLDGNVVDVNLWDDYCDEMHRYIQTNQKQQHVVLIIQFGSFNNYRGNTTVSNAFDITKLYINADVDEIASFKERFLKSKNVSQDGLSRSIGSFGRSMLEEEFLNKYKFYHIGDLKDITLGNHYIILGTIKSVATDGTWYYNGCTACSKKISKAVILVDSDEPNGEPIFKEELVCNNPTCHKEVVSSIPMYKIPIRVQDCTGIITITLFDKEAVKLVGITANNLVEKYLSVNAMNDIIPSEFETFIGKKFSYKIQVSQYNINNKLDGYSVGRVIDDVTILDTLEKRISAQYGDGDSSNCGMNFSNSQTSSIVKDATSMTGDNETPVSSTKTIEKSDSSDLKRNLESSYRVDDFASMSSSKNKNGHPSTTNDMGSPSYSLKVPKVEK